MENLKKKRSAGVRGESRIHSNKKRAKKEPSHDGATPDDAELEEFLAILKRFQAGFNRFQSKAADDRVRKSTASPPATCSGSWCPAFELEDFKQVDDGRLKKTTGETSQNDTGVGFDLNSDPIVDRESS